MASPMQTIDPAASAQPVVHVVTDDQLQALAFSIAAQVRAGTPAAQVKAAVKGGAEEVVANFQALVTDVENTLNHVHGAAKQLQTDVKANRIMIGLGVVTLFNTFMILHPLLKAVLGF